MVINGVSGAGMQPGTNGVGAGGQMDATSRELQNQIENLQKQMKELSSNQEMSMETKMKKRQELQKQISDLEVQLRQHQMEVKREAATKKREEKGSMDDMLGTKKQEKQSNSQSTGMSADSMEALISADASMKQAGVHGSTAKKMEGKANVLETEISLDGGRGGSSNVELKEEQLAKTKAAAEQAAASQMESLAQANKDVQDAASADDGQKAGDAKTDKEDKKKNGSVAEEDQTAAGAMTEENEAEQNTFDVEKPGVAFSRGYNPVDVRL